MGAEVFNPVFNLERDIRRTWWMVERIREDTVYAQNLYAACCNNVYGPHDVWAILKNVTWSCGWRYASNMVAEICGRQYSDFYCSGVQLYNPDYVPESVVTPAIRKDFENIGWILVDSNVRPVV
jgi:hypothetical protein